MKKTFAGFENTLKTLSAGLIYGTLTARGPIDIFFMDREKRQTETFIKINMSFAITMSLNSDPNETCAKTREIAAAQATHKNNYYNLQIEFCQSITCHFKQNYNKIRH